MSMIELDDMDDLEDPEDPLQTLDPNQDADRLELDQLRQVCNLQLTCIYPCMILQSYSACT